LRLDEERIYKKEGLTIRAVAARMAEPEYRVRQLINAHLGFRNFNAFLHHYRIRDARESLRDAAKRHLGVAEIAYELGYQSLGPFNKAFKEITGQTPMEFRKGQG
jgi:AraC-like DNA-binding protein